MSSSSNETFWDELFNPLKRINCVQASSGTTEAPLTYLLALVYWWQAEDELVEGGFKGRQPFPAHQGVKLVDY